MDKLAASAHARVLGAASREGGDLIETAPVVQGINFDEHPLETVEDYRAFFASFASMGFQAQQLGRAVEVCRAMYAWSLADESYDKEYEVINREDEPRLLDPAYRRTVRTKVFLGFTSNLISSGLREVFVYLARHRLVDVVVTTAGGIEEDFIKCLGPTVAGDWELPGAALREHAVNRIGNLLISNDNYVRFEEWLTPILDQMKREQDEDGVSWTPSKIIRRLGREINDERSLYYWCYRNDIPVYSPALTDGSIGDMLFFHRVRTGGLRVDIVEDVWRMNNEALEADAQERRTGAIILGGGLPKHHIFNANLMRNGLDFVTIISTTQEFDGSDGGARLDEAVSWGKVRPDARAVKVFSDATLAFPLLVAQVCVPLVREREAQGL